MTLIMSPISSVVFVTGNTLGLHIFLKSTIHNILLNSRMWRWKSYKWTEHIILNGLCPLVY